jgi:hypothetical protein
LLHWLRLPQGMRGELLLAAACLAVGALLMPGLIWIIGRTVLGPYAHGSVLALYWDFFGHLAQGAPAFWTIALGPYLLLQFVRIGYRLLH